MTVKELRAKLAEIENQNAEIEIVTKGGSVYDVAKLSDKTNVVEIHITRVE